MTTKCDQCGEVNPADTHTCAPVRLQCNHQWFSTGAMAPGECRCIQCGTWGKLISNTVQVTREQLADLHQPAPVQEPVANETKSILLRMAMALEVVSNDWRISDPALRIDIANMLATPPAAPVQDAEGENKAVRSFLMLYGQRGVTVGEMKRHMAMSSFKSWPMWVETEHDGAHLTKAGAQLWIRHLFALEATPPAAQPATVQEPVARVAELEETVRQLNHALREATEVPTFMGEPVIAEPAAKIKGVDEYGPLLEWAEHWVNFPVGTKLYTTPPAQPALKDHETAQIVNRVTAITKQYGQTEQLRERIAQVLFPAAQPAPVQEPDELKHIDEQDCLLDVDEKAWRSLVENRGGCRCHISPPCGACSNPISEEEMNEVGYTYTTPPAAPVQEPVTDMMVFKGAEAVRRCGNLVPASDIREILKAALAAKTATQPAMPDINAMVGRFLAWKLPKDFYPDSFINFDRKKHDAWGGYPNSWPTGTNLLNGEQARQMLEHVVGVTPAAQPAPTVQEPTVLDITIDDDDALSYLRDMVVQSDGDLTPIRLLAGDGHSGRGLYVASADYPEEGAIKIADIATTPPAAPVQEPVWTLEECKKAIDTLNYIQGIAERGEGRAMRDNESLDQFVLGYVKKLEAAQPAPVQEPVAWVDLLKQAEEVVRSKSLWKKYIDGTPLENDIAVWMASFAQEHAAPPAAPVQQILAAFPLLDDAGLDQDEHHCEWALQQDRKRLHAMLAHGITEKGGAA